VITEVGIVVSLVSVVIRNVVNPRYLLQQVVDYLSNMVIPQEFRERIEDAVVKQVRNEQDLKKIQEIEAIVKRIDFSWEQGFLDPQEYIAKRELLRREIDALERIDFNELEEASGLLENFHIHWENCRKSDESQQARKQLLSKIIKNVYIYDKTVVGVTLYGGFGVVLNDKSIPQEICVSLVSVMEKEGVIINVLLG
jgi:flagellin-specific chaperone FliS